MIKKIIGLGMLSILFAFPAFAEDVAYAPQGLTFWQLLKTGGWVMIVIGLFSVLTLALGIFCFFWLNPRRYIPAATKQMILDQIRKKRFREAFLICDGNPTVLCRMLLAGLRRVSLFAKDHVREDKNFSIEVFYLMENVNKSFESIGIRETDKIRAVIQWFSNMGFIAPLLGLLGTILGMIRAFGAIAFRVETGKPVLLASAISQAMVATAGGLIVAIAAMMLYYYFSGKADEMVGQLESTIEEISEETETALRKREDIK